MNINEFNEIIVKQNPSNILLERKEELFLLFPLLKVMDGFDQKNPYHIYDLLTHSLKTLDYLEKRSLLICLTALFHDCGKPDTFFTDEKGIGHFYGHGKIGAENIYKILLPHGYDMKLINKISSLIYFHDYPIKSDKTIKKAVNALGDELIFDLYELKKADILAHNPECRKSISDIDLLIVKTREYIEGGKK